MPFHHHPVIWCKPFAAQKLDASPHWWVILMWWQRHQVFTFFCTDRKCDQTVTNSCIRSRLCPACRYTFTLLTQRNVCKNRLPCLPGPSDPERGEFSLGRFAVGGPTSSRLSAILISKFYEWMMMMMQEKTTTAGSVQLDALWIAKTDNFSERSAQKEQF